MNTHKKLEKILNKKFPDIKFKIRNKIQPTTLLLMQDGDKTGELDISKVVNKGMNKEAVIAVEKWLTNKEL